MGWAINPRSPELNYVTVAGLRSPGRAAITGLRVPYEWEIRPGYGTEGATTIFKGRGLATFTLTIAMWLPEHFIAWPFFAETLKPPTKLKPLVAAMSHPSLADADVKAVVVKELGIPERQANGLWLSVSQMLEYRPSKPALVKPRGAFPSVDKGVPIAPKTEADFELAKAIRRAEIARAL